MGQGSSSEQRLALATFELHCAADAADAAATFEVLQRCEHDALVRFQSGSSPVL
jgi:hypothetical protein